MNYRHPLLIASIAVCAMATTAWGMGQQYSLPGTTQTSPTTPQEKFNVIVQKEPKSPDVKFHYVFCNTTELQTQCLDSAGSPIKYLHSTKNSSSFAKGFSLLIKSKGGNPPASTGYVRLLVVNIQDATEAKAALQAKLENRASPQQEAQIITSPAVRRQPDPNKVPSCKNIPAGSSIGGKLTFIVKQTQVGDEKKIEITVQDRRTCKKSKIAKVRTASGTAYNTAKTKVREFGQSAKDKAKSAWDSTKTKVGSAASSAKASLTKRFGK